MNDVVFLVQSQLKQVTQQELLVTFKTGKSLLSIFDDTSVEIDQGHLRYRVQMGHPKGMIAGATTQLDYLNRVRETKATQQAGIGSPDSPQESLANPDTLVIFVPIGDHFLHSYLTVLSILRYSKDA